MSIFFAIFWMITSAFGGRAACLPLQRGIINWFRRCQIVVLIGLMLQWHLQLSVWWRIILSMLFNVWYKLLTEHWIAHELLKDHAHSAVTFWGVLFLASFGAILSLTSRCIEDWVCQWMLGWNCLCMYNYRWLVVSWIRLILIVLRCNHNR